MTVTPSRLLVLLAVILFVLSALGVALGSFDQRDLEAAGLALGFASFLV